eukprot:TRINITY_DN10829_c0_g1_i2.p2 TRINITY_DN10829_c0_g1~~TRINITY_DN10829_c0_g1_i2.p2  ORF type:complete len:108 (+),score=10.26 TRINITY_DN10829_c0_g1_i2:498-821(+)
MASANDNRVIIFDTTLRDGEQSPGASMTLDEKLRVAHALAEMKVDIIEAGFAIASNGDFRSVNEIAKQITGPYSALILSLIHILRAHETVLDLVCRLLLEKKNIKST